MPIIDQRFPIQLYGNINREFQKNILIEIEIEPLNTISILILSIFQVKQYQPFCRHFMVQYIDTDDEVYQRKY